MQDLLRWLASWKGIPLEENTDLHIEFGGFPTGGLGLLVLVGIALALFVVVFAYRRDAQRLSPGRRAVLMILRLAAVITACLILLEPLLVAVRREVHPGHTIVLLDVSQSMGHRDAFRRPEVAPIAQSWRGLGVADVSATTRIDLLKHLVGSDDQRLLNTLAKDNKVLVYGFSSGVEALAVLDLADPEAADAAAGEQGTPPRELDLAAIAPTGRYTNLGGAVRRALEQSREASVAGILLFSDGRRNLGAQGPEIARILRQRKIPHTVIVPIGDPSETQTLQLTRIEAPEKVFQKDPFTIRANVEAQGYDDVDVAVHLKRQAQGGQTVETVRTERVRVGGDRPQALVEFDRLVPEAPGMFTYSIEIDPPDVEAPSPERHFQRAQIEVLGEQTRVILLAGGPSHEYRILRNLLTRDKTIEVACWLSSADATFSQDGNVQLEELPDTREKIEKFDVFIVMDPDSSALDRPFCEMLAEQITENGAGMWWVCGEKYTLGALREDASTAPLAELLPVVLDIQEADENIGLARGMPQSWRFELTPEGEGHKATRIVEERSASASLWPQLPGFHFAFPVLRGKPAAQVLVTHGKPTTRNPAGAKPMLATHFVGAGRVLFTATDDTYRWRHLYEQAYDRFWVKGLRHLFEGRLTAGNSRLRINIDEEKIELGEAVKIEVEARTETYEPLIAGSYELTLTHEDKSTESIQLAPVEGLPGHYEAYLRPTTTGYFSLSPASAHSGRPVQTDFQVVPAAIEKEGPADLAELGAIASVEGGRLVPLPEDVFAAAEQIRSETKIESFRNSQAVWDSWVTISVLLGLLSAEWWLRKRSNLL